MAKYYGKVGYEITSEISPGVWRSPEVVKRYYSGDIIRRVRRLENPSKVNDDINISNEISIVADPFAYQNFCFIKYAEYMGVKWKVSSVEVQHPRLILSLGGIYNGEE